LADLVKFAGIPDDEELPSSKNQLPVNETALVAMKPGRGDIDRTGEK
jgi:hypothetical protein